MVAGFISNPDLFVGGILLAAVGGGVIFNRKSLGLKGAQSWERVSGKPAEETTRFWTGFSWVPGLVWAAVGIGLAIYGGVHPSDRANSGVDSGPEPTVFEIIVSASIFVAGVVICILRERVAFAVDRSLRKRRGNSVADGVAVVGNGRWYGYFGGVIALAGICQLYLAFAR